MTLPLKEGLDAMAKNVHASLVVAQHWHLEEEGLSNFQRSRLSSLVDYLEKAEHCVTQLQDRLKDEERKAKGGKAVIE